MSFTYTPRYTYKISAGNNVSSGSLTNIEMIIPTSDRRFLPPTAEGHHTTGAKHIRGNGLGFYDGFESVKWIFKLATRAQYEYLITTYCTNGLTGPVTLNTRLGTRTYVYCNGIINVPDTEGANGEMFAFRELAIEFTRIVRL